MSTMDTKCAQFIYERIAEQPMVQEAAKRLALPLPQFITDDQSRMEACNFLYEIIFALGPTKE